jgi:hypothetical protein
MRGQTLLSVQDYIQRILNSRRSGLAHRPDQPLHDGDLQRLQLILHST